MFFFSLLVLGLLAVGGGRCHGRAELHVLRGGMGRGAMWLELELLEKGRAVDPLPEQGVHFLQCNALGLRQRCIHSKEREAAEE